MKFNRATTVRGYEKSQRCASPTAPDLCNRSVTQ
jgi:hypothetical protein